MMACQKARSSSGPSQLLDHVLGELADVEVEVIRSLIWCTVAGPKLVAQLLAALPAGDVLAPGLGRQGERWGGWAVPAVALADIVDAAGDLGRAAADSTPLRTGADRCSGRGRLASSRQSAQSGWKAMAHFFSAASNRKGMIVFLPMYSVMSSLV